MTQKHRQREIQQKTRVRPVTSKGLAFLAHNISIRRDVLAVKSVVMS